ncbi:protein-disulfide reductase DsbD family protein [Sphingomonas sp. RB1R13]|uniref:protein-disulfide reductase DsbD family protein n=1 Tax=Sphingomonas sp. RB1R13 TaxID=3096159 RepID=UPI002FC8899B
MTRLLLLWLVTFMLVGSPAMAGGLANGRNAIQPELVAESSAVPGESLDLAIVMHTTPGWHGYWLNPGEAGLPMTVAWQLPAGMSVGDLRYPVPTRLILSGITNYVYDRDYALLVRVAVPKGASGIILVRAKAHWLACTEEVCVPEHGLLSLDLPVGDGSAPLRQRFDEWRRALPRPIATPARFAVEGQAIHLAIPLPASVTTGTPYFFPGENGPIDLAAPQKFRRSGDWLVADLVRKRGNPAGLSGVISLGDGRGLSFEATPGAVPSGGETIGKVGGRALLLALLGALAGGILLNLMPCVFPILAIKALHLARSGGDERTARREALGYAIGAILGTGALGALLLVIRAGGSAAGWAFQLQDPRTILLLMLLAGAITLNLLGLFRLPVIGGDTNPTSSIATGALAAFVATPCAGPFLGAALGTALLLPAAGSIAVFAVLGLGLALPFVAVAFIPALRERLPRPGAWMVRLQRFLAIPMAATAAACLWLLWRQAGGQGLAVGLVALALLAALLFASAKREGLGLLTLIGAAAIALGGVFLVPQRAASASHSPAGATAWSEAAVRSASAKHPTFVYFTADWCLTCKVNEAAAIDRAEVRDAFKAAGVRVFAADWTNGDPAITRFIETQGRAGVPLYLWYEPGKAGEELPQVLTPNMLIERAQRKR